MKRWQRKFMVAAASVVVFAMVLAASRMFRGKTTPQTKTPQTNSTQTQPSQTPSVNPTETPPKIQYYYPISGYSSRILYRWFGKYVTPADDVPYCGAPFTGYHDGDDLEATAAEQNVSVPVLAISDSTVRQVGHVSGYGGLIVLGATIKDQDYTVYYGHIDLSSTSLKVGDAVTAGQKLANLGAACSAQTDGERKHLHFAIHKGNAIDVRGYVPNQNVLSNWINPKDFLATLGAK